MSAFVVSKTHIDGLIMAALDLEPNGFNFYVEDVTQPGGLKQYMMEHLSADDIGAMLWAENYASVNACYREDDKAPDYTFTRLPGMVTRKHEHIMTIFKMIACFEYQSCEHDGWKTSAAKAFCEALRLIVIGKIPGYSKAPGWELDDPTVFGTNQMVSLLDVARRAQR